MKAIAQGAEAVIYEDAKTIIKDRVPKRYRHQEIDSRLRRFRTRREAKVIGTMREIGIAAPQLLGADDKGMRITMSKIEGPKLRDALSRTNYRKLCREVGSAVARMHENGVIHGDLTTSNMILSEGKVFFIDFGLVYPSRRLARDDNAIRLVDRARY